MTQRPGRPAAALLLAFALTMPVVSPVFAAEVRPSPSPTATAPTLREAITLWTASIKVYKAALANRTLTLKAINESFAKAIAKAKSDYDATQFRAAAPALSNSASARYKEAVERAAAIRQTAIDALPELPPNPGPKPTMKSLAKSAGAASRALN